MKPEPSAPENGLERGRRTPRSLAPIKEGQGLFLPCLHKLVALRSLTCLPCFPKLSRYRRRPRLFVMIVMIGGIKGGTGKSTIATNLAAYLANGGADVLLLDVDPQRTAYNWAMRRKANYPDMPQVHTAQASGRVFDVIRDVAGRYQHIVIDSGGHASDAMKSAMLGAQKLYVPLRPSQADLETVGDIVGMIADVKSLNMGLQAFSLLSLASTNPSVVEALDARAALEDIPDLFLSPAVVRDRKIYRDAFLEGVGVVEMTGNKAAPEIQLLAQEIYHG